MVYDGQTIYWTEDKFLKPCADLTLYPFFDSATCRPKWMIIHESIDLHAYPQLRIVV